MFYSSNASPKCSNNSSAHVLCSSNSSAHHYVLVTRATPLASSSREEAGGGIQVLQRKLDLCKNELEAVRVKFRVPTNFFESDA
jgi:hypothetical protein